MKCLGLLGGEKLEITSAYAQRIADEVRHRFGHSHACNLVALSVHTAELTAAVGTPTAKPAHDILQRAADALCQMGAEAIVPCSSRLQKAAGHLTLGVPLLPMYDALGGALQTLRIRRVGLVGAGSETEEMHWRRRLARYQVLDPFVPVHRDREHSVTLSRRNCSKAWSIRPPGPMWGASFIHCARPGRPDRTAGALAGIRCRGAGRGPFAPRSHPCR